MRDEELGRRKVGAQLFRETDEPLFSRSISGVHRSEVLIIHVDSVKIEIYDKVGHGVRCGNWIETLQVLGQVGTFCRINLPMVVGSSVDPNAETIRFIPALLYSDLIVLLWPALSEAHV
jgi:hypothetical protein